MFDELFSLLKEKAQERLPEGEIVRDVWSDTCVFGYSFDQGVSYGIHWDEETLSEVVSLDRLADRIIEHFILAVEEINAKNGVLKVADAWANLLRDISKGEV